MSPGKTPPAAEDEAWAALLPDRRDEVSASIQRKSTGCAASAHGEYVHFAGLDLTNMGR